MTAAVPRGIVVRAVVHYAGAFRILRPESAAAKVVVVSATTTAWPPSFPLPGMTPDHVLTRDAFKPAWASAGAVESRTNDWK